jgi:hypothetical protein
MSDPLLRLIGVTVEDRVEYLIYGFMRAPTGVSPVRAKGDDLKGKGLYTSDEVKDKLWAHTVVETITKTETTEK